MRREHIPENMPIPPQESEAMHRLSHNRARAELRTSLLRWSAERSAPLRSGPAQLTCLCPAPLGRLANCSPGRRSRPSKCRNPRPLSCPRTTRSQKSGPGGHELFVVPQKQGECAGLESAKAQAEDVITQLQHMHTELSGVREEARSELAEEARWRTQLQQDLADLKAELQGAQQEPAHMHSPGPLLEVEGDASMNETRDQVI